MLLYGVTYWVIFQQLFLHHLTYGVPCNSFPKFIGADSGHTNLHQFDVYWDYIVLVGDTSDSKLTGSAS